MRSSFAGLEMSKRTIQIAQKALDVSTGNMGNIKTAGYTRQRVDVHSMHLRSFKNWQTKTSRLALAGQGVNAHGVAQVRDFYLDKRFREMNGYLNETIVKQPVLEELQTTIDLYENIGMDAVLAKFKESLSKYATNSAHLPDLASNVRESALNITRMLNSYARDFDRLLEDNVWELGEKVNYVNTLIERVASFNEAIVKEYKATEKGVSPYGPLELIDERNLVLDELSSFINIRVHDNDDGSVRVELGDVEMINGTKFERFVMQDFASFNAAVITASNGQNLNFKTGELKGFLDLVNGNGPYANSFQDSGYGIPYYRAAMDAFAETFAVLMNETNGVIENDSSRAMFGSSLDVYDESGNLVERGPITASTIRISEEWMKDPTVIGRNYDEIEGFTTVNFDALEIGTDYTLELRIGGQIEQFTFTPATTTNANGDTIVDRQATITALNEDIVDRFELAEGTTVIASGGLIGQFAEDRLVTVHALSYDEIADALIAGDTIDFGELAAGSQYSIELTVGDVTQTITFTVIANEDGTRNIDDTVAALNDSIRAHFGLSEDVDPVNPGTYGIAFSIDGQNATVGGIFRSVNLVTSETAIRQAATANLDGNNPNSLLLALDKSVKFGRASDFEGTVFDYVSFVSNRLGQGLKFIDEQRENLIVTTNNLLDSRDAVSGVSDTEEGINMLIYQKWFNAASRMMTALDDCLDRVINNMGRVGL